MTGDYAYGDKGFPASVFQPSKPADAMDRLAFAVLTLLLLAVLLFSPCLAGASLRTPHWCSTCPSSPFSQSKHERSIGEAIAAGQQHCENAREFECQ